MLTIYVFITNFCKYKVIFDSLGTHDLIKHPNFLILTMTSGLTHKFCKRRSREISCDF